MTVNRIAKALQPYSEILFVFVQVASIPGPLKFTMLNLGSRLRTDSFLSSVILYHSVQ